jgi:hypothetical protein
LRKHDIGGIKPSIGQWMLIDHVVDDLPAIWPCGLPATRFTGGN